MLSTQEPKILTKSAVTFFSSLIAQAWEDEAFKQQLLENPELVLQRQGQGKFLDARGQKVTLKVAEATTGTSYAYDPEATTLTLFLPAKPEKLEHVKFSGQFTPAYLT